MAYQPPASSIFLSEQPSHQQPASSTFLSEQTSTSHQPPAKRTGCGGVYRFVYGTVSMLPPPPRQIVAETISCSISKHQGLFESLA
jgi:hypothetical protein